MSRDADADGRRGGSGLRLAAAMSLRTRIAAVASVSVALAVLAVAAGLYVAVRSDLRGEIDGALRARARGLSGQGVSPPPGPPGGRPPSGAPPGGGPAGAGGFPGSVEPAPFGAASGYVEFLAPGGQAFVPGGQGSSRRKIPVTARDRAIAAAGSGSSFTERDVDGMELRVL
ncbi:MAG TPA: hypothetical protein VK765_03025, partial [Solirubrobacteraceae bacterium]|nr:hypothetical protein [Solirubrobacteraceae bacterium]